MNKNVLYRSIPKVDILLGEKQIQDMIERYSRETVMEAIHGEMEKLRAYIGRCEEEEKDYLCKQSSEFQDARTASRKQQWTQTGCKTPERLS